MADKRFVNDAVSLGDEFGTLKLGDRVALMALEADPPFTIGVTGKWGSGKTSVLRRAFITLGGEPLKQAAPLREAIQETTDEWDAWRHNKREIELGWSGEKHDMAEQSLCVWYSPWQHQTDGNPVVPLLLEIRNQFSSWTRFKKKANNLNRRGGLAGLALIGGVIDTVSSFYLGRPARFATEGMESVRKAWRDAAPAEPRAGDGQRLQLQFEDAVQNLLDGHLTKGEGPGRLIVFIDDLDRCEERVIVELLEAIKLYLGSERCVFVLGLDENAVADALARHWKGRSEDANREYLEKLFQAMLPLPPARLEKVRQFICREFHDHGIEPRPKPETEGELGKMVAGLLEPNPRRIKNFVNSVCAMWPLFRANQPAAEAEREIFGMRFLLLAYLRSHHKPVWRLLERQPWSLRFLTQVVNLEDAGSVAKTEDYDPNDQRLLIEFFRRAFTHVLRSRSTDDDVHGHYPLDKAVDLFHERIDRKRSDEVFIQKYRIAFAGVSEVPPELLYFPAESK